MTSMRTVGIVAEYNPFHTGHAYHLKRAKEASGTDYTVAVMSPDFVQRGEPAVFDKYARAQMALRGGADLVLELPVCYATGSAEYFARGAAALLDRLGVVDALCFGCETADDTLIKQAARLLAEEPAYYRQLLQDGLRGGMTFPQARAAAARGYLDETKPGTDSGRALFDLLLSPNNILAVEYCKALRRLDSRIRPIPVERVGSRFHSAALDGEYCSAAALRREITNCQNQSGTASPLGRVSDVKYESAGQDNAVCATLELLSHIPDSCRELFLESCRQTVLIEDLTPLLRERLLSMERFDHILDISADLSDRIRKLRFACIGKSYEETVSALKTKQITESRVRRALLHLILGIDQRTTEMFRNSGTIFYARVLGFRKDAGPLLHEIRRKSSIPLITRNARAQELIGYSKSPQIQMWKQDIFASHLYRAVRSGKYHTEFRSEYEFSPVIL